MKNTSAWIALVILLAVTGCKLPGMFRSGDTSNSNSGNTTTTSDGTTSSTSGGISPSGDAMEDLKAAFKRVREVRAFQAVMNGTGGKDDLHMEMGYAAPNRYRIKNGPTETIIIGDDTYMNLGGKWRKFPINMGSMIQKLKETWTDETLKSIHDAKYAGEDSVNGKPSLVYTYASNAHEGVSPYTTKLWLAKDTGLPQKFEIEYIGGSLKNLTTSYEYNDVPIDPPVKS
jgi:outer membrane lipoprotein-sorting protein